MIFRAKMLKFAVENNYSFVAFAFPSYSNNFPAIHMSNPTAQIKNSKKFEMLHEYTHSEYLMSISGFISKSD